MDEVGGDVAEMVLTASPGTGGMSLERAPNVSLRTNPGGNICRTGRVCIYTVIKTLLSIARSPDLDNIAEEEKRGATACISL